MVTDPVYAPACLMMHDGNVYAVGYYAKGDRFNPVYWVDGVAHPMDIPEYGMAYSMSIDTNGGIYIAGSEGSGLTRRAVYWKNGVMTPVSDYKNACAREIFALDGNLILVYFERNENNISTIKCMINGETFDISDGSAGAFAEDVFIL